jgi:UDP-glucose 4-epimerase
MATILLTGATGYIASHTWVALWEAGFDVVGVDNFSNSSARVLDRLARLGGRAPRFECMDVRDRQQIQALAERERVDAAVHFAGHKAVGESVSDPLRYFQNNLGSLLSVCEALAHAGAPRLVFSSSATVYGIPERSPIAETAPCNPANPYGLSKRLCEQMLLTLLESDQPWRLGILRYFNPVGAHESGLIGEDPRGIPNNLMPFVAQVAVGRREKLSVFGHDYATPDGTGQRDYIHVMDLAEGHVAAVRHLLSLPERTSFTLNLGSGQPHSVLEVVKAFEAACGKTIAYQLSPRRPGDIDAYWADPSLARSVLGWSCRRDLHQMCADTWRWQSTNPQGYSPED